MDSVELTRDEIVDHLAGLYDRIRHLEVGLAASQRRERRLREALDALITFYDSGTMTGHTANVVHWMLAELMAGARAARAEETPE